MELSAARSTGTEESRRASAQNYRKSLRSLRMACSLAPIGIWRAPAALQMLNLFLIFFCFGFLLGLLFRLRLVMNQVLRLFLFVVRQIVVDGFLVLFQEIE